MLLALNVDAQEITVTGRVTDEAGTEMPGVNIVVKGTTKGTTTDTNGAYSLSVSEGNDVLVFSFIGYETAEQSVSGRTKIDVTLMSSIESLSEIVVVGYGTQKKTDLTGAVASVSIKEMENIPNTNMGQMLQGTVPGLNVGIATTAGGTPPIQIRGQVSLNGNKSVLIILDGVQYTGSLSSINPDDVASIDVLKDASATAVYGAQAANGVILITSRKGSADSKPRIAFSSSYSVQSPTVGDLVPMNREQYLNGIRQAFYTDAYTAESGYTEPNPAFNIATKVDGSMRDPSTGELLPNDFNWWRAGTKTGKIFENNLSISGGTDRVTYLLSGGFVDQEGYIMNDKFKRISLRANLEIKATNWMKVGLISSGSFVNQDGAEPSLSSLQRASPLHVPFDAAGNLIYSPTNTIELNPFVTYYVDDYDRHNYYFANIYTELEAPFLKGLTYRLNFGNNYRVDKHYYASEYDNNKSGRAYRDDQQYYDYTLDNIISYKKTIGKHDMGLTLVYGAIERKFDRTYVEGTGFSRLNLSYNNLGSAAKIVASSSNDPNMAWREQLLYQMARVNYKYNDKYLITATVRRDGFSGFSADNKYAIFPSVSGAWIMSEESFIKDNLSLIDQLKLRVGYGESGNQTPRKSSLSTVVTHNAITIDGNRYYTAYVFGDGGAPAYGQLVNTLGNGDLKWERTKGVNIGLDFMILDGKTSASIDFYNNNTHDLLYQVPVPIATGFSFIQSNVGQLNNKGLEISVTQQILNRSGVDWSATVNFSTNKNRIKALTGQDLNNDGKEDDFISRGLGGRYIGESINTFYDYEPTGHIYDLDDTRLPGFPVGSMEYVDQDGDGAITQAKDLVILGRAEPAYRFSIMNNVSYKGFNLSILVNSVQGGKDGYRGISAPTAYNNIPNYYREDNTIRWNDFKGMDYWSPTNPDGKYPRNISGSHPVAENRPLEDRSFVRLQDISLSYDLKYSVLKNLNVQRFSVFVSGKNLHTWTKWKGFDPESEQAFDGNRPNDFSAVGVVAGGRPILRAFTAGLNITF
jgi:TonB-linked SusC/RagA family outer membrane protein